LADIRHEQIKIVKNKIKSLSALNFDVMQPRRNEENKKIIIAISFNHIALAGKIVK